MVAVINFLAFLGWNPGTEQELFSLDELVRVFDPERIHKAGARFDYDKALWFNQQYVQALHFEDAKERLMAYVADAGYVADDTLLEQVFSLLKARVHRLTEIIPQGYYFFTDALVFDESEISKKWQPEISAVLNQVAVALQGLASFTAETSGAAAKEIIMHSGVKMGIIMPLLRAALTGTTQGPDVWAIAALLGQEKSVLRIRAMAERK
jgi:glutamyl-tRNA synthetase